MVRLGRKQDGCRTKTTKEILRVLWIKEKTMTTLEEVKSDLEPIQKSLASLITKYRDEKTKP